MHAGRNAVVVTPTASGKTLCYNLPILNAVLENPDTRALYLFPTKALAQDQLAELHDLGQRLDNRFGVFTYDGDTPSDARAAIRERGHIVLTNPDMLHAGILPHHTRWTRLFENLRYIVLDELHTYRGVFGSHLANVLRRLRRVAQFYGASPQFIACSATIANPARTGRASDRGGIRLHLGEWSALRREMLRVLQPAGGQPLSGHPARLYRRSIAPRAGVSEARPADAGLREQPAAYRTAAHLFAAGESCRSGAAATGARLSRRLSAGRAPRDRTRIAQGRVRGVVSTNALELGIDVGSLDAVVMAGYPGAIASTWQRAGRAGRRTGSSCALLVASSAPIDQFIVQHPEYFFGRSPEHAFVQPDNLEILVNHLKCAAFELPIAADEKFGGVELAPICERLAEAGFLHRAADHWHWVEQAYPADAVSLRAVTSDNFVIVDTTGPPEVIGEVDFSSALTTVHPKAVYLHQGQQYQVERLDFDERSAYVKRVDLEYYTDAIRYTQVRVLEEAETARIVRGEPRRDAGAARTHGDVLVRSQVVGFKKIKFFTNENVGSGKLELPENEMHTTAFWLTLERPLIESLPFSVRERQSGMHGLLYALGSVSTLLLDV